MIFESILLGISFAAIPGPIFFEIVRRTLVKDFWSGIGVACGDKLAQLLILILIFLSVYQLLLLKTFKIISFILGGLILIWIGYIALRLNNEDIDKFQRNEDSRKNSIFSGFAISITNPLNIFIFVSVSTYLAQYSSKILSLVNIILFILGGMILHSSLAGLVQITRNRFDARYVLLFSKIFGIILIGYGINFWYQFIKLAYRI